MYLWKPYYQDVCFHSIVCRTMTTVVQRRAHLVDHLKQSVEKNELKPRKHPGRIKIPERCLPDNLKKSFYKVFGETPLKQLSRNGVILRNYLLSRQPPVEKEDLAERKNVIAQQVKESIGIDKEKATEEQLKHYEQVVESKVVNILKQKVYNWKTVNYSRHLGLVYLFERAAPEYVVLRRLFEEIKTTCPHFQPKTLFDFGSGVGTVRWAAEGAFKNSIEEYFCVDTSKDMNDLAVEVLENAALNLRITFHRQFLPASYDNKYDIVVSAYSLLELPSISHRLQVLSNLWNKTLHYLVIVERGTNAGFKVVNEARDFLLMNSKDDDSSFLAHILAPCPHEFKCPRLTYDDTPCNFCVPYEPFNKNQEYSNELYSYIIMSKVKRNESDAQWPRIIRPVLIRKRHVVCKLCTAGGSLEQVTVSPTKPNKATYSCAKSSKWGDTLPVHLIADE